MSLRDVDSHRKNLTLFCQVFHPDEQSTAQLFSDWVAALVSVGWDVRVVCGFPPKHGHVDVPARELWRGVDIRRVGVKLDFKRSLAARIFHYSAFLLGVVRELLRDPDRLALAITNPPFLPLWCAFFRGLCGGRFAIEIQDLYPDGLIKLSVMSDGILARAWRKMNRLAFSRAEFVIVLGRDMAERLGQIYGVQSPKIFVIPHWSPIEPMGICDAAQTNLFYELGLSGGFVVQYSGNMGLWHDIDQIIRAAEILKKRNDITFLMIGGGRRRAEAEILASKKGLKNMIWLDFQPKNKLADSLSACQVALISQREGLDGVAVPCKLYGILAVGRAVIAAVPESSEVARVVKEEGCGLLVPPGDDLALAQAIELLANNANLTSNMSGRSRFAYERHYTLKRAIERFEACCLTLGKHSIDAVADDELESVSG